MGGGGGGGELWGLEHLDFFSGGKGQLHTATDGPGNVLDSSQILCLIKVSLNLTKTREQPSKFFYLLKIEYLVFVLFIIISFYDNRDIASYLVRINL